MTLSRYAALSWSAAAALLVIFVWPLRWWHPYCDAQVDGPGYYAMGVPLPFVEPTGVSTLENFFLPLPFALDVVLLTALLFALAAILMRGRSAPRRWIGLFAAASGSLVCVLLLGAMVFLVHSFDVTAWSFSKYDSYFSYRPYDLVAGAKPCAF